MFSAICLNTEFEQGHLLDSVGHVSQKPRTCSFLFALVFQEVFGNVIDQQALRAVVIKGFSVSMYSEIFEKRLISAGQRIVNRNEEISKMHRPK